MSRSSFFAVGGRRGLLREERAPPKTLRRFEAETHGRSGARVNIVFKIRRLSKRRYRVSAAVSLGDVRAVYEKFCRSEQEADFLFQDATMHFDFLVGQ